MTKRISVQYAEAMERLVLSADKIQVIADSFPPESAVYAGHAKPSKEDIAVMRDVAKEIEQLSDRLNTLFPGQDWS